MSNLIEFLICDDIIIPAKNISLIFPTKDGYNIARMNKDGTFADNRYLSPEGFQEIKNNLLKARTSEEKIRKLEKRIQTLEQHISLMPGGIEYLLVENDFEENGKKQLDEDK